MHHNYNNTTHYYFAGVAGAGMSAIAQYLSGSGKHVSGSDRLFNNGSHNDTLVQLEAEGIKCHSQEQSHLGSQHQLLVVSTAIEDTNTEVATARQLNIPIITRAQLLADICNTKRTIAIAGTSGKSTTAAMLYHMLQQCGVDASLITGAGIVTLIQQGKIGNCWVGKSDWLIIEADESDGSIVNYTPEIGVLLSVDKDHKEITELNNLFTQFKNNTTGTFICNQSHSLAKQFSVAINNDFGTGTPFDGVAFTQQGFTISFTVNNNKVHIPTIGKHNMENALACLAIANNMQIEIAECCASLATYPGIYRRHQLLTQHKGVFVIDDYAHNPAKIAASIKACQPIAGKLIAWFQPHGYGPTRFIRKELVHEIAQSLRTTDEVWMSEIYYAGGTAVKDISAGDLINDLKSMQIKAYFVADRALLAQQLLPHVNDDCVLLLMGARDPSLEAFTHQVADNIINAIK
jgi:UDP-N-acetylmuramate--alanine ligase